MKIKSAAALLATLFLASFAMAAGDHAGGHAESDAIGKPGKTANVKRTIAVDMTDAMRFTPGSISVQQGETIKFIVKNSGKVKHEMMLGTEKELKEHNEVMKKNPEMEHADENMVTLQPGKSGEIVWQFTKAGQVNFACLQPGHYDAGMKGAVMVGGMAKAGDGLATRAQNDAKQVGDKMDGMKVAQATLSDNMASGEVRKIDLDSKKITLKHGDIKNLDMPGMTMVFQVKDPAMLEKVKAGDKVKFSVEKLDGAFVVTEIQPTK